MAERLSSVRRQITSRSLPGPPTQKHEDMEGKDNIDYASGPGHDTVSATLNGNAQRKPARSRTQVSTRLREEPLSSVQGEILASGGDVQNRDEHIASSVNERAENGERAIAKEGDVLKEQETSKNTGGAKAQRIMDELNDSARMAKKIAELQVPKLQQKKSQQQKLKQQVSNIEKHLEEQRTLEEQLENRNAEIDRLRVDLCAARTNSEEKDQEINQLRDSLERLRREAEKKSAGFISDRDSSLEDPVMTDVREDFNLSTDREKRGDDYLLSSLYRLISLTVDGLPIAANGIYDSSSPPIVMRKARLPSGGDIDGLVLKSRGQYIFTSTAVLFFTLFFFYYTFQV